ncbi:hypothetical protein GQ42DRAFT_154583 [Ramicandelaber brevisporus]|nr:hypothetical protein GQ42DRAFT_154583 [Ramicandelaber brevisporus]
MQRQIKRARLDPAATAAACQLFRLPHELLELVAAWFSRGEAVPVLTVNSTLHEIIAERIWRCIDTYLARRKTIPPKPLLRYGHLVRRLRITWRTLESIDLAATFPNLTHLWIPIYRLADIIESSQGKCFERLNYLSTYDYINYIGESDNIEPVINWINNRFEAETGLEKMELEVETSDDIQLPRNFLNWLQFNGQLGRIHFKGNGEILDFSSTEHADYNIIIANRLVDWTFKSSEGDCAAESFSNILDTIPSAERQHFTLPALKRLYLSACCDTGVDVYSQFNFGTMFPSVQDLILDTTNTYCEDEPQVTLSVILAHPWPSVRKLNICGDFTFKNPISHLAALSNVEEFSIDRESNSTYHYWAIVNLCELDQVLPKLVRLKIGIYGVAVAPKQQQEQQKLFRHLRHITLAWITVTSSAISALVNAPLLTDICLKCVKFGNDNDANIFDKDYNRRKSMSRQKYADLDLDFLIGITSSTVRSVDIYADKYRSPSNYEDILRAMLRCFIRMRVCIIRTNDGKALPGVLEEFPAVKFNRLE